MKPTISIIIPALNEEANLEDAVREILTAVDNKFSNYEILIFDDASSDNTGIIADRLAAKNENIKVIHNARNMGFGCNYKRGIELAQYDFIIMPPGDNPYPSKYMARLFDAIDKADIIIGNNINQWIRPLSRQVISKTFRSMINILFGLRISYYNGLTIHKVNVLKSLPPLSGSFAYQAENLVLLIKSGYSYLEVPVYFRERKGGKSKAFRMQNIINVLKTILKLSLKVHITQRRIYNKPVKRVELNTAYEEI